MRKALIAAPVALLALILGILFIRKETPVPVSGPLKVGGPAQEPSGTAPEGRLKPLPQPSSEFDRGPKGILARIRKRFRDFRSSLKGASHDSGILSQTMFEHVSHLTEARLWAWAFRDQAEDLAVALAEDPKSSADDHYIGVFMLGALAERGSLRAENILAKLARQRETPALGVLIDLDPKGKHRSIYTEKAIAGSAPAAEVLGSWDDPVSHQVLQEIRASAARQNLSDGGIDLTAQAAQEQLKVLRSPGWEQVVERILENPRDTRYDWLDWALRVAQDRGLTGALPALQRRLESGFRKMEEEHKEQAEAFPGNPGAFSTMDLYGKSFAIEAIDHRYDDLLVACHRMGGDLTERQKARLRMLGYGADPESRLMELLAEPSR